MRVAAAVCPRHQAHRDEAYRRHPSTVSVSTAAATTHRAFLSGRRDDRGVSRLSAEERQHGEHATMLVG